MNPLAGGPLEIRKDFAQEIFETLREILEKGRHASSVIGEGQKRNPEWSDRQRALFSNTIYDIIRYWRFLWTSLGMDPSFKDRDLWHLLGAYTVKRGEELDGRSEFRGLRADKVIRRIERIKIDRCVRESIPDWIDDLGQKELGEHWDSILHALNTYPSLSIRVNTLKTLKGDLKTKLRNSGHDTNTVTWAQNALVFRKKFNVFRSEEFQEGLFEVQDPASQIVSEFLGAEPGMNVIDACAGQGGKTLHLSCLMENKGRLIAMDDVEWKLMELRKRAKRAGSQNIEAKLVTGTKSYKRMKGKADRLLLDVPCSGLGALRRNPDIKWSLTPETLEKLRKLQREILLSYSPLLKSGGRMVYATCSILPSEGEEQVRWFIREMQGKFRLVKEKRTRPDLDGFDGFYMALMEMS
jgi:16S rRNA (cytosine967-C5)-methyltransferase